MDEEDEAARKAEERTGGPSSHSPPPQTAASHAKSSSTSSSFFGGSSKDKKKDRARGKRKPFNLEAEKEQMKSVVADASITSTNLLNAVQGINRERERVSENPAAQEYFEASKLLRRKILRYVRLLAHNFWGDVQLTRGRFTTSRMSIGWAVCFMPTTSSCMRS